jgi:hypothetical protein
MTKSDLAKEYSTRIRLGEPVWRCIYAPDRANYCFSDGTIIASSHVSGFLRLPHNLDLMGHHRAQLDTKRPPVLGPEGDDAIVQEVLLERLDRVIAEGVNACLLHCATS